MTRIIQPTDDPPRYPGIVKLERVSIGQAKLIEHYSLLIPKGEPVHIPVNLGQSILGVDIEFDDEQEEASMDVSRTGAGIKITFLKWDNVLGTALDRPVQIANLPDGQKLLLMAANYAIGNAKKLDLQLLLQRSSTDGE